MRTLHSLAALFLIAILSMPARAAVHHVPDDFSTIQAALEAAAPRDTVIVEPGEYTEFLTIDNKELTLASRFLLTGDRSFIARTILDGGGIENDTALLTVTGRRAVTLVGMTLRNSDDGIMPTAPMHIAHCHMYGCKDAIDYESGSGGTLMHNVIERNVDDAVDLDEDVSIFIENNVLRDNDDDGIEIRLQAWDGHLLHVFIQNNIIEGNGEDGIQFIGYNEETRRRFVIKDNLFADNEMAAIACMDDSTTREDYRAAALPEIITVRNNTFFNNPYGIVGGANMRVVDNLFLGCSEAVLKGVVGQSSVEGNMAWECERAMDAMDISNPMSAVHMIDGGQGRLGMKWPKLPAIEATRVNRWSPAAPPKPDEDQMDSAH